MSGAVAILTRPDDSKTSKVADALARDSLFANLSAPRRMLIAQSGALMQLEKGQRLFSHGEPSSAAYAILTGEIEIAIPGLDGRPVWLARIGSNAVVGEMGALDGTPRATNASATRRCELLKIDKAVIHDALVAEPQAAMALIGVLARRLRETDALVERTSSMELGKRLARFLLIESVNGKIIFNQSEMAHHIGSSREAVNRKLERWRKEGWVELRNTGLHVLDRTALLALCKRNAKLHI
jgi:CRP/FNR family transcriptional regulator, cyclic AMP receptor protein